jgi:hypothetical protein
MHDHGASTRADAAGAMNAARADDGVCVLYIGRHRAKKAR